jgi:hypothetical protein
MALINEGGKLLLQNGALANGAGCCCGQCDPATCPTGTECQPPCVCVNGNCVRCSGPCDGENPCPEGCACDNCFNCVPVPYVGCFNTAVTNPDAPGEPFFPCSSDADCSPGCFCVYDLVIHLSNGGTLDNFFPSTCVPVDICSQCDPETEYCVDYDGTCFQAEADELKALLQQQRPDCTSFHIVTGQPVGGSVTYQISCCYPKVFP